MSGKNVDHFKALASLTLQEAYYDFILSRQASRCSPATLEFYKYTSGKFISWLENQGINSPLHVSVRHVREYIALQISHEKSDNTVHDIARDIKTLLRFWHNEKYIDTPVTFSMPKVEKKRLPCLSAEELETVFKACSTPREKAMILLLADSGLRRAEAVALNWGDVDMSSGLVTVKRGKGGKPRSSVVGAMTRRILLSYRRTLTNTSENAPLFQSREGARFTGSGFRLVFTRLSKKTGIPFSPHAMRRTFVILSLRGNMDVLHLQAILGHSSLDMVQHYAQLMDEDLIREHRAHSPVDNLRHR
ncbi:MAG: tyrosine-type recombinase/integrase [Chloroflexi bacterium]|nr:tyrosine-type recombinase/integrase [Chloroflexota bacterium]